jgi:hypothetical protein
MRIFLILILCIGIVMAFFNVNVGNELYEEQAYKQLITIAESKALRVEHFLDNRKVDAIFLAESEDVGNIFDKELVSDSNRVVSIVNSIAERVAGEVEEYLLANPGKTVEELREDEEFKSIAIQQVGETGYTDILDTETQIQLFHKYKEFEGFDPLSEENKELFPDISKLSEQLLSNGGGGTFYRWRDPDGVERDKYGYYKSISAGGYSWHVGATAYLEEYGPLANIGDLSFELRLFQFKKGYADLILISPEGSVIWTAKQHSELGTNLVTGIYNESLLANVFNKAKKDIGVGVSDSQIYGPEGKLEIFITAPVMRVDNITGKKELQGIVALELDGEKISELIEADLLLGEAGEVYIINRNRNHITSLKFNYHDSFASENINGGEREIISSEGIENCFDDYNNYYFVLQGEETEEVPKTGRYLNYVGDSNMVLGAHQYILESGWCVIAEMDEDYFLNITPNTNRSLVINLSILVFLLLISSLLLDSFFKIRRKSG